MRAKTAPYPRPGGVVVPAALVRAGAPAYGGRAAVVDWLFRSVRRLPDHLLAMSLPGPGEILGAWPLGAHTQGALARIGEDPRAWALRDYLHRPRMGAAAIVDLLAAHEENAPRAVNQAAPAMEASASATIAVAERLGDLAVFFRQRLPARADALGDLLVTAGLAHIPPSAEDVLRAFRDGGLPVPFRIVRRLGTAMAVQPTGLATTEAFFDAAAYLVLHWGVCTLDAVLDRLRSLSARDLSPRTAARILDALPQMRWLDAHAGWFSLAGCTGRVGLAIRKIFGVAERVPIAELVAAIGKRTKVFATVPRAAIEAYLVDVAGCEIADGFVKAGAGFVPAPLDTGEQAIVEGIIGMRGDLTIQYRRALAAAAGVTLRVINHFVSTSPIVITDGKRLRLAGIPRALALA
jgi:hypothetical protein